MTASKSPSDPPRRLARVRAAGLAAAIVAALLLAWLPGPERLGDGLFDLYQRAAPRDLSAMRVQIVEIDPESLAVVGPWPWSRYDMARLTERIGQAGAVAIGFDMFFPEVDRQTPARFADRYPELSPNARAAVLALPSLDDAFVAILSRYPTVLARAGVTERSVDYGEAGHEDAALFPVDAAFARPLPPGVASWPRAIANIPFIEESSLGHGLVNGDPDDDGVVRRVPAVGVLNGTANVGLSVELARLALGQEAVTPVVNRGALTALRLGNRTIPLGADGRYRLHFGTVPPAAITSAADLLRQGFDARRIAGKIVVIGVTGAGGTDIVATPLDPEAYGLHVQAQAADAVLRGGWLERPRWAPNAELGSAAILAALAALCLPMLRGLVLTATATFALVLVSASSWLAFWRFGLLINPIVPASAATASGIISVALTVAHARRHDATRIAELARARAEIRRAFDRYLSPELIDRIERDPNLLELGGEERDMTVMFCDIRGFSALSEQMTPQQIIKFLIAFLTPMSDILIEGQGTIDKYVGDAIIAFWNAPLEDTRHAENAADAALAMVSKLKELNHTMPAQDRYPWPGHVRIGVGLNAGQVCVGNIGSERRINYSMIGDTVNLASRIEGLTKLYGVTVAVGDALAQRLPKYAFIELDRVRVVGRNAPETVHALLGGPDIAASEDFAHLAQFHVLMLAAYRRRNWNEALAHLEKAAVLHATFELERLAMLYHDRIMRMRSLPPDENWDGVFQAIDK